MLIGNKELIDLFGSDSHKEYYTKHKKVNSVIKNSIIIWKMSYILI